jgi:hypothetical protein
MKNKEFFSQSETNKELFTPSSTTSWVLIFLILFGLMLTSLTINAQSINKKVAFAPEITEAYIIKEFTAKVVNNKIYFRFLLIDNRENTNYTLESSSNGTDFYAVKLKEGFKSPNGIPLLYCYSLDLHEFSDNTYRIRMDSDDGGEYSSALEFNSIDNLELSAQKN